MSKFSEIINKEIPVLVDFYAEWCGPCKTMSPILKQVKDNLQDKVSIVKIDVDKNQKLAAKYQVKGVPTLVLFKTANKFGDSLECYKKTNYYLLLHKLTNEPY